MIFFFYRDAHTANARNTASFSISMHLARSNGAFALLIREASRPREKVELLKTGTSLGARLNILTAIPRVWWTAVGVDRRNATWTENGGKKGENREGEGGEKGLIMAGRRARIEEKHAAIAREEEAFYLS